MWTVSAVQGNNVEKKAVDNGRYAIGADHNRSGGASNEQTGSAKAKEEQAAAAAKKKQDQYLQAMYEDQADASDKAADAFADMAKMMEIARRIANGDRVPGKDEQKLMEFNSKLYQAAKQAAIMNQNKKHKTYKSMFEDEEDGDKREQLNELERENAAKADTTGEAASVEVSGDAAAGNDSGETL